MTNDYKHLNPTKQYSNDKSFFNDLFSEYEHYSDIILFNKPMPLGYEPKDIYQMVLIHLWICEKRRAHVFNIFKTGTFKDLKNYMYTCIWNLYLNLLRKGGNNAKYQVWKKRNNDFQTHNPALAHIYWKQIYEHLTPKQYFALSKKIEGFTYEEIGEMTKTTGQNAKQRTRLARDKIRKLEFC